MTLLQIREKLESCATKDSSWTEKYTHPLMGHAANFSLILRLETRGTLMKGWAVGKWLPGVSVRAEEFKLRHYWIRIKDIDVDFTWSQFPVGTKLIDVEDASGDTDVISDYYLNQQYKKFFTKYYNQ